MRVQLLYPEHTPRLVEPHTTTTDDLREDTGLEVLLDAMTGKDVVARGICAAVLLDSNTDPDDVSYRQAVLRDALAHPDAIRELYSIATDAVTQERKVYRSSLFHSVESTLDRSVQVMTMFVEHLRLVRRVTDALTPLVESPGVDRLCSTVSAQVDDEYLDVVDAHIRILQLRGGLLFSARMASSGAGTDLVVRQSLLRNRSWWRRSSLARPNFSYTLPDRDDSGFRALADFRSRGLEGVAAALEESVEHVLGFFRELRDELAFYVGCLSLWNTLKRLGVPLSFPAPTPAGHGTLRATQLIDVGLALQSRSAPIPVDVAADGARLLVITGANRGGKSTLLRALGLAQMMQQAGMFVAAQAFSCDLATVLLTHFKREEDESMRSGKLDEELRRMRRVVDAAQPGAMVLCNESFASTNEVEASQIGYDVVLGLTDAGVRVILVTHLYDLATRLQRDLDRAVFLRAARYRDDRHFSITVGDPLPTSYGEDVFAEVFGAETGRAT